jgi:hypothetical protein
MRTAVDYEIHIAGAVPGDVLGGLEDVQVLTQPLTSTLSGTVTDLAALHGLINRLHGAGLQLIEVHRPVNRLGTVAASDDK